MDDRFNTYLRFITQIELIIHQIPRKSRQRVLQSIRLTLSFLILFLFIGALMGKIDVAVAMSIGLWAASTLTVAAAEGLHRHRTRKLQPQGGRVEKSDRAPSESSYRRKKA